MGLACDEGGDLCVPPVPVILNEYNAVSPSDVLKDGGTDTYWGTVLGNGGDWFELVVTMDQVDMRGWQLEISDAGEPAQTLTLSNDSLWAWRPLRNDHHGVGGSRPMTSASTPASGDWWINVQAATARHGSYVTASDFSVSNSNWQLTILDASSAVLFGPAGEGINPASGIGSTEVFKLEEDPGAHIAALTASYNDGTSSTFGAANLWSAGTMLQDFSAIRLCLNDAECDDALFCNGGETCDIPSGTCQPGIAVDCDDGVSCTIDGCNEASDACESAPDDSVCDNAAFCDGAEICDLQLGCQAGSDPCPGLTCDEGIDRCTGCTGDPQCDDGVFCNGPETCIATVCEPGIAVGCDDGVSCTVDSCNVGTDSCDNLVDDAFCDNAVFCDGVESCDALLDCQAGVPEACDDGVSCTVDSCNVGTDSCDNLVDDGLCDNGRVLRRSGDLRRGTRLPAGRQPLCRSAL